jgi:predicted nucleic acid-binding protein
MLDSLIGATAVTHHLILLILATLNTKHFASFPGLHIERPY